MGLRYVAFRIRYALETKLGVLKKRFPKDPDFKKFISLMAWRENTPVFFFESREKLKENSLFNIQHQPTGGAGSKLLETQILRLKQGIFTFFSSTEFNFGKDYDWITNPETGYKYDINKHWSEIQDLSKEAGDIKYVWEKSRFGFLYDIIRYDYHFDKDNSEFFFNQIEDFINKNPINQGPNYKCSQEISLRLLNWTFALYFYKKSKYLSEERFEKIINSIYWQLHHVYDNINFSRIAVRNNHAITETLMLYLSNKLFPFIQESKDWSNKGKKWFEEEIAYQIYEDGTFLQFSMNYHRVVVQLLTWAIQLAKLNKDSFDDVVYDRAERSLEFLDANVNKENGFLPNYGSNDGALFFKLTDVDYRDYRSQLDDLRAVLKNEIAYKTTSYTWYGVDNPNKIDLEINEIGQFKKGGYYLINDENSKTFIKCGAYKDRPAQSDNLHLDIWVNGINYLRDNGSYKYNTKEKYLYYFNGCEGHNTASVDQADQMLKGGRFIWYYWVNKAKAKLEKVDNIFEFKGTITAFKHEGDNIQHQRKVKKQVSVNQWEVEDTVLNKGKRKIYQYWHLHSDYMDKIEIISKDNNDRLLKPRIEEKWYSGYYGVKERSIRYTFVTDGDKFNTEIRIKEQ